MTTKEQNELFDNITEGLKKVRSRLIKFKKEKDSEIVVMKNGKIIKMKPE